MDITRRDLFAAVLLNAEFADGKSGFSLKVLFDESLAKDIWALADAMVEHDPQNKPELTQKP